MNKHVMIEREFADNPPGARMNIAESGLVSEDVWWDMVAALLVVRDEDARYPSSPSRGRHHRWEIVDASRPGYVWWSVSLQAFVRIDPDTADWSTL